MKRFDQKAINDRILTRLRVKFDWALISENSNFSILTAEISESLAEMARYMEYLFAETKWENALNLTSQTHLGSLLGRKPARPKSATGFVICSTTDAEGKNRLGNFGINFFDLNDLSNYDNIEKDPLLAGSFTKTLVPWTFNDSYYVPKGTKFIASSGIEFISTQTITSRTLQEAYSSILRVPSKVKVFNEQGGWDGIKYLKIPVIQGKKKTIYFGNVQSSKFETFKIESPKVEDASNSISQEYLKFIVTLENGNSEEWLKVPSIYLADAYDKVFEVYTSDDGKSTLLKVGNGITGALLPTGATLTVEYLESEGEAGNILEKYNITSMSFPESTPMIDPRTGTISDFIDCTNITPIQGGQNAEDESTYKESAPLAYLDSYTIGNASKYEDYIKTQGPMRISKLKIFKDTSLKNTFTVNNGASLESLQESFNSLLPVTKIVALDLNNEAIENAEDTFIKPLVLGMANLKNPTETIEYESPVFADLGLAVEAKIADSSISQKDMEDSIKAASTLTLGIENTEFGQAIEMSEVIKTIKSIKGLENLTVQLEAKANIDYENINLVTLENTNDVEFVIIPFSFDPSYNADNLNLGFKNYKNNIKNLLRVDLEFINTSNQEKSRTLFLRDNRAASTSVYTNIQQAKDATRNTESAISYTYNNTEYTLYDENIPNFNSLAARVAQFKYISKATTPLYLAQLENFATTPSEIRPCLLNSYGERLDFAVNKVQSGLAIKTNNSEIVYKKDTDFISLSPSSEVAGVDIYFDEDYSSKNTPSKGFFAITLDYLGFKNQLESLEDEEKLYMLKNLLTSFIKLNVTALPLATNFQPTEKTIMSIKDSTQTKLSFIN